MYLSVFTDELAVDVTEALPIVKSWGLDHVDLRGRVLGGHFQQLSDQQLVELGQMLDEHGLQVGCLESSLAKVHLPDAQRQSEEEAKLESIIRVAEALDCNLVRSFFYWQPGQEERGELAVRPDALQQVLTTFGPLANRARGGSLTRRD